MAGKWTTISILDANGAAINLRAWDVDGAGGAGYEFGHAVDGAAEGQYETVAASQTDQVMGVTGASGDFLAAVLIVPATTSPDAVSIKDGSTSIAIFTGGATSVADLKPFLIPLRLKSISGAWKITTGSNVSAIGIGNFTA